MAWPGAAAVVFLVALLPLALPWVARADGTGVPVIARFSGASPGEALPAGWRDAFLSRTARRTRYRIVDDAGISLLQADSDGTMSGVSHTVRAVPLPGLRLSWRWRISGAPRGARFGERDRDDFAARVYVLFDYDLSRLPWLERAKVRVARSLYGEAVPAAALCYVWDPDSAREAAAWSPFTDRVRVIVATSGAPTSDGWVAVSRDIVRDYLAAFGEPVPPVTGVVLATDTDNTGSRVTAWYGDLVFSPARP
ncbi:MAG: DUF3047 domain-containing protein [Betaproteobacteria bacterium]